jgi:hypothetical protein
LNQRGLKIKSINVDRQLLDLKWERVTNLEPIIEKKLNKEMRLNNRYQILLVANKTFNSKGL